MKLIQTSLVMIASLTLMASAAAFAEDGAQTYSSPTTHTRVENRGMSPQEEKELRAALASFNERIKHSLASFRADGAKSPSLLAKKLTSPSVMAYLNESPAQGLGLAAEKPEPFSNK